MLHIKSDTEVALHRSQLLLCCPRDWTREWIRTGDSYIAQPLCEGTVRVNEFCRAHRFLWRRQGRLLADIGDWLKQS